MAQKLKLHARVQEVERICGHHFSREHLVVSAITHPSAAEGRPLSAHYERLEFLGDSLLGTYVALYVYERFPGMTEGELSFIRTTLISGEMLARIARGLGLAPYIIFGQSERGTQARGMRKALEDVYEALVAALYLDGGTEVAQAFVERTLLVPYANESLAHRQLSPKSELQEVTQRRFHCGPEYKLIGQQGPAHTPTFTSVVLVDGRRMGRGKGSSKKESEAAAAHDALVRLGYADESTGAGVGIEAKTAEGVEASDVS